MLKAIRIVFNCLAIIILSIGAMVLIGWAFDISILKSVLPNLVTMKANTAVGFVLIGLSLLLLQDKNMPKKSHYLAYFFASVVLLIGLLTIIEYWLRVDLKIDQLLFKEDANAVMTSSPGRMAINTAINFVLFGLALLLINIKIKKNCWLARLLVAVAGFISLLALVGYLYGVSTFYQGLAKFTAMAVHTTVLFLLSTLAILFIRNDENDLLISKGSGGILFRRFIPVLIIATFALGWLVQFGVAVNLYNFYFGLSLLTTLILTILIAAIFWIGNILDQKSELQKQVENVMAENERRYKMLFNYSGDAMMVLEPPDWKFTSANTATIKLFGVEDEKQFLSFSPADLSPKLQPDGQLSSEKAKAMIKIAMDKGSNFFEWVHKKYKGDNFYATVLLNRVRLGDHEFLQATVRDITKQKEDEQNLQKHALEMERMNKLMVGRELRMVELKKQINELKNKVNSI